MSGGQGNGTNGDAAGRGQAGEETPEMRAALAAVEGLGVHGSEELPRTLVEEYEHAAGAAFAAWPRTDAPEMPAGLEERVADVVFGHMTLAGPGSRGRRDLRALRGGASADFGTQPASPEPVQIPAPSTAPLRLAGAIGWLAAAGLLAVVLSSRADEPTVDPAAPPSLEQQVADLTADGAGVWSWADGGPAGEVVWSDARNQGFMKFEGLERNDPTISQYQLWIFKGNDPGAEPYPVDGGVFDVLEDGEVIVPIDAKLDVGRAGLFAVTVEKPGGVVVSGREKIVAVAVRG